MDGPQRAGPFSHRRTFSVGPASQQSPSSAAAGQAPSAESRDGEQHKRLQRTVSAPTFTRRTVEPLATSLRQQNLPSRTSDAATKARPPFPTQYLNLEARTSSDGLFACRTVSPIALPCGTLPLLRTPSVSPDPSKPCDVPSVTSFPNVSSICSLHGSFRGCVSAANGAPPYSLTTDDVLPSIASLVPPGGLDALNEVMFRPHWSCAWASPRQCPLHDTTTRPSAVSPAAPLPESSNSHRCSVLSPPQQPEEHRSCNNKNEGLPASAGIVALRHLPASRHSAVGEVSTICLDSPGQMMQPQRSKMQLHTLESRAGKSAPSPRVRIRVEGCSGLPSEHVPAEGTEEGRARGLERGLRNELYVYLRSNRCRTRYKLPSVPYATEVLFPQRAPDIVWTVNGGPLHDTAKEEEELLVFTVAVKLTTGRQVKLGIGQLSLCNFLDGQLTRVLMPIVTNAGTARARERGVLKLVVETEVSRGVLRKSRPALDESVVHDRILTAMRRVCREKLHQVEVYVRHHCTDSAEELKRFLLRLEADRLLGKEPSVPASKTTKNAENEVKVLPGKRTKLSPTSSSASYTRAVDDGSSSPFTSCVLEEPHAPHRSFSDSIRMREPKPQQVAVTAARNGIASRVEQKFPARQQDAKLNGSYLPWSASTHSEGRNAVAAYQRSYSASFYTATAPMAASNTIGALAEEQVRVVVHGVYDLCDEDGLPLLDCANCFVHVSFLGSSVCGSSGGSTPEQRAPTEVTTDSAAYDVHQALFPALDALLCVPSTVSHPVLCCTAYQGTKEIRQKIGSCEVSLTHAYRHSERGGRDYRLVRHAGSPLAHICGRLRVSVTLAHGDNGLQRSKEFPNHTNARTKAPRLCDDAQQKQVLSYLWHHFRAGLHRLDSVVEDAVAFGFKSAVAKYSPTPRAESKHRAVSATPRNSVCVTLRFLSLMDGKAAGEGFFPAFNTAETMKSFSHVYVGWSCGCYGGRSCARRVSASESTLYLNELLSTMEDVDPWRDELRFVLYGIQRNTGNCTRELCRVHVSLRVFRVCQGGDSESARLPLVWHAGERGAFEHGYLSVAVEVTEPSSDVDFTVALAQASPFRRTPWAGFSADWPPRKAVGLMLRCYASDQLHRLLPLLASSEGAEESLLRCLQATYGPASEPVQLRVCLVGFRCLHAEYRRCYLKLYRGEDTLLRTPTIECRAAAESGRGSVRLPCSDDVGNDAVALLDEDKYLFQLRTTAPQHETILLKMGVAHLLKKNDVVAYAEIGLGAFVSLERRLEESMQKHSSASRSLPLGSTQSATAPLRPPLWVPLCNDENDTIAEVALRVEWTHPAPLAPVRRVTTQKKNAVTAVLRSSNASSNGDSSSGIPGGSALGEAIPLLDTPTSRDLLSLLSSYRPEEFYRSSWYLSRWADATKAHQNLRRELLPPQVVSTIYVDLAGISPRTPATLSHLEASSEGELVVSAFCLDAVSPCPAYCRVLSRDAASATVEATAVLRGIDGGDGLTASRRQTLRLDLQMPTSKSVHDDLCLVFSVASRNTPIFPPRTRALSAPKRGRRLHSADRFRQIRAWSAAPLAQSRRGGDPGGRQRSVSDFQCRRALSRVEKAEVGRMYLSLRALLTTPELYREGEMVTVPLGALCGNGGCGSKLSAPTALLGDVYVRVRTPTHEPAADWLRYNESQLQRMTLQDFFSRDDVRSRLAQRQRQLVLAADVPANDLAEVHAAFFRKREAPSEALLIAHHERSFRQRVTPLPPTRAATQTSSRPPLVPRHAPSSRSATTPGNCRNVIFTVREVFPRISGCHMPISDLSDYKTPAHNRSDDSLREWTCEMCGNTVDRSSGTDRSTPSLGAVSSHECRLATKRALIF
ncbi:hypothetical protein ABL78_5344 [Leptomonas seymouri]|uniref:Uncharacterized protein n=1 Tax=Leptomonas seymouri TaxID=5684 RepID=A0A0N0P4R5_LEPSE|nr:hypothetical protein ABL78_5344 [Leptomonas seymouri]|eukprot:KPI85606.1 hypothetical protein ABL78_5344 [Leptomonas seymouri]